MPPKGKYETRQAKQNAKQRRKTVPTQLNAHKIVNDIVNTENQRNRKQNIYDKRSAIKIQMKTEIRHYRTWNTPKQRRFEIKNVVVVI